MKNEISVLSRKKVRINNMGTIRNRVVIVHHYRKEEIEKVRQDAVDFFQKVVL